MKTLKEQAQQILMAPKEGASYFLRRYYSESHLRINSVSGSQVSLEVLTEIASNPEYDQPGALDWLWDKEDDEFLLASHVSEAIAEQFKALGVTPPPVKVVAGGSVNGVRYWSVSFDKEDLDGTFNVFDVRGAKALASTVHAAYYCPDQA